ncbi:hypothetical protein G6L37_02620 [Agrobacterium rubi]|nr:hypothetical protein [Agrobacterium rubi]NTF24290.1 hypothetical protein [Agrobacterium rubi]
MNAHLTSKVDLLAVRDGTKFDFILKNAEGKVCGVVKPLVFSNIVQGVHIETTGLPRRSSEFFFDRISAAAAAAMFEREQMGSHIPSP